MAKKTTTHGTPVKPDNIQEILKRAWVIAWELEGYTWEEKSKEKSK